MQKLRYTFLIVSSLFALLFCFCQKKKDTTATNPSNTTTTTTTTTTGSTSPTFSVITTSGTTGNTTSTVVTVTGTSTNLPNQATQNSSIQTGGSGWSNVTCASTNSLTLKTINGSADISVTFSTPPSSGTYQVSSTVGAGLCVIMVNNAPNQPSGVVWYGKTGLVSITTTTAGISAVLNNVQCVQSNFQFPQVTITGTLSCN